MGGERMCVGREEDGMKEDVCVYVCVRVCVRVCVCGEEGGGMQEDMRGEGLVTFGRSLGLHYFLARTFPPPIKLHKTQSAVQHQKSLATSARHDDTALFWT